MPDTPTQNSPPQLLDPTPIIEAEAKRRRRRHLLILLAFCGVALLPMAVWLYLAYGPTGLAREVARVEAKRAALPPGPKFEPPAVVPGIVSDDVYPEDQPFAQLMIEMESFAGRNREIAEELGQLSAPFLIRGGKVVAPDTAMAAGLPLNPSADLIKALPETLPKPQISYTPGMYSEIGPEGVNYIRLNLSIARKQDRRLAEILPHTPDAVEMVDNPPARRVVGMFADMPLPCTEPPMSVVEHLALVLADSRTARKSFLSHRDERLLVALWGMEANALDSETRREIIRLLDEAEARYKDPEWQRTIWEIGAVERHRRARHYLDRTSYARGDGWQHFFMDGVPMSKLTGLFRPVLANRIDTYTARLLRGDGQGAVEARSAVYDMAKMSGIRVPWAAYWDASNIGYGSWNGRAPFEPVDAAGFLMQFRIVAAIAFYRADTGAEPESLDALIPKYLPADDARLGVFRLVPVELPEGYVSLFGDRKTQVGLAECVTAMKDSGAPGLEHYLMSLILPVRMEGHGEVERVVSASGDAGEGAEAGQGK